MPHLNRDQRLTAFVLWLEKLTMVHIAERIDCSERQVRYALVAGNPILKKKTGRKLC